MVPATTIAIEGPDRVGKKTQTALLVSHLKNLNYKVYQIEVPVNDRFTYPVIYWMLRQGSAKNYPRLFQFIQFLNKFLWQLFLMPYLSWKYQYIVLDRWAASSVVYGRATGISEKFLHWTYSRLFKPDATIILMGDSHKTKDLGDSYECDSKLQEQVRVEYDLWSLEVGFENASVVDNHNGKEMTHNRVINVLGPLGHDLL